MTNAKADPQNNMYTPNNMNSNPYQHYPDILPRNTLRQSQHIIFNAIGEMAAQMMYVHVNLPLNLTALYDQAQLLESYLYTLTNTTTSEFKRIPFTKAARDTGEFGLRRLARIMQKLENVDHNLPHVESRHKREEKKRIKRGDQACIWGYSTHPERCDLTHDVAQMILDPIAAIVEAIRGPKYEDTEQYQQEKIKDAKETIAEWQQEIDDILFPQKPNFPEEYWEMYKEPPKPETTTFRPFIQGGNETELKYYRKKVWKLAGILGELERDRIRAEQLYNGTLPDFYIHNREKRFIQALTLVTDIVGTFLGAFNAYEIQQLKAKFSDLSQGHNMLVRVTQQHDKDIHQLKKSLKSIIDVIHLMSEYNPGLLQLQITEQLDIFEDRVTIITNTIQQLHHRRLAVDLLTPEQMEIMHEAVNKIAADEHFHNQAEKLSDYYQIEVTYSRTDDDIVVMVHVPCIKTRKLLTIYRYLPFPIPIPFTPKSHDLTISQSLKFQELQLSKANYEDIFDQKDLDHPQIPEALFITDTTDMIAIDDDRNFQVLTQTDLANCVQRNHVYLCDKQHVVKHDLTDTCLGSLYLRTEEGVRKHCKFERKPIQEMVYQLTDTEHLVYSPTLQTAIIICKNQSSETVHIDMTTKITVPENCYVKLLKHTITSTATNKISAPPLSYAWAWDPFTLPSTTLDNPQHLDHMIQELRERIYNIQSNATDPTIFEQMIVESTFSVNYTSVMIWLSLAMASLIYLVLFIIAFIMYIKHRKALAATSQNQNVRNPTNTYINPTHTYAPVPQSHEPQNQVACIQRPPNPPPPPPPQHQIYPNHHYTHVPQPTQNQLLLQELSQALINHSTNPRNTLIRLNPS